jgi:hypothetical protein
VWVCGVGCPAPVVVWVVAGSRFSRRVGSGVSCVSVVSGVGRWSLCGSWLGLVSRGVWVRVFRVCLWCRVSVVGRCVGRGWVSFLGACGFGCFVCVCGVGCWSLVVVWVVAGSRLSRPVGFGCFLCVSGTCLARCPLLPSSLGSVSRGAGSGVSCVSAGSWCPASVVVSAAARSRPRRLSVRVFLCVSGTSSPVPVVAFVARSRGSCASALAPPLPATGPTPRKEASGCGTRR